MTDIWESDIEVMGERIEALTAALVPIAEHLARVDALLSEFEPIIRAYLDPAASGPLAWAVRKKMRGPT